MDSSGVGWIGMGCLCLVPAGRAGFPYIWGSAEDTHQLPATTLGKNIENTRGKNIEKYLEKQWCLACNISESSVATKQPTDWLKCCIVHILATKKLYFSF